MQFEETPWSLIVRAKKADAEDVHQALDDLCRMYWTPLYAFARTRGQSVENAQDIVQTFFETQLRRDFLKDLDPQRGHFRSYLLTSISNFMINEWSKSTRQKRGSGKPALPLDEKTGELAVSSLLNGPVTPEEAFEREWALVLIQRALDRTREYYVESGTEEVFDAMQAYISVDKERPSYADLVDQLGMSESSVKSALFRLRGRYRDAVRQEVRRVVQNPDDENATDDEIRYLMGIF